MARRNLHGDYQNGGSAPAASSTSQFLSNVRSQLNNGYSAIRDRLSQLTNSDQQGGSHPNSPSRGVTSGGTRFSRTSSQSSASGGRSSGYNLRSRPVHSTPRDSDNDQPRKTSGKPRRDNQQQGEIDEEENGDDNDEDEENNRRKRSDRDDDNSVMHYLKKGIHVPIAIFNSVWKVLKVLPWWILIPLLILFGIYTCEHLLTF